MKWQVPLDKPSKVIFATRIQKGGLHDVPIRREEPAAGDPARWLFEGAAGWKLYDVTSNKTIEAAYANGQQEVTIAVGCLGGIEASKFELLGEDKDCDSQVFHNLPRVEWQPEEPWLQLQGPAYNQLPLLPDIFLGREIITRHIVDMLMRSTPLRLVTLHGQAGVGKHSVGLAVARYVLERGYFPRNGYFKLSAAEAEDWTPPPAVQDSGDKLLLLVQCSKGQLSSKALDRLTSDECWSGRVHLLLTALKLRDCDLRYVNEHAVEIKPLDEVSTKQLLKKCCSEHMLTQSYLTTACESTRGNPHKIRQTARNIGSGRPEPLPPFRLAELAPPATYLQFALLGSSVRPHQLIHSRCELGRQLIRLEESLQLCKDELQDDSRPIRFSDGSDLQSGLMEGRIHSLVWCAAGSGWEHEEPVFPPRAKLEMVGKHCGGENEKRPRVIVVCMQYGARRAAEWLQVKGAPTVLWLSVDMYADSARALCPMLVRVLARLDTLKTEDAINKALQEALKEALHGESALLEGICFGCLCRCTATGTQWLSANDQQPWCQISAQPRRLPATNLGKYVGHRSGLLVIDEQRVGQMREDFRDGHLLQCLHGDRVQRCKAIATDLCLSYLYDTTFHLVQKLSSIADFDALQHRTVGGKRLAEWSSVKILIWVQKVDVALLKRLLKDLHKRRWLKEAHVLLTCNSAAADVLNRIRECPLDFKESPLEPIAPGSADSTTASKLVQDFRLMALDGADDEKVPCCLLDLFEAKAVKEAFETFLREHFSQLSQPAAWRHTITSIYADEGGCMLRMWVSDVKMLHWLREAFLSGNFENKVTDLLNCQQRISSEQPAGEAMRDIDVASTCTLRIMVDQTQFAEQYEQMVLELEELTEHQEDVLKLAESEGCARAHIRAAAGAGKTFVALHRMLEALRAEDGGGKERLPLPLPLP